MQPHRVPIFWGPGHFIFKWKITTVYPQGPGPHSLTAPTAAQMTFISDSGCIVDVNNDGTSHTIPMASILRNIRASQETPRKAFITHNITCHFDLKLFPIHKMALFNSDPHLRSSSFTSFIIFISLLSLEFLICRG